jgi:asparagine synthase (glutamine-hydrolysing)
MCGIAGIWSPLIAREERERHMQRMLARLKHRGPSGMAMWSDGEITLGFTRLAIVAPDTRAEVTAGEGGRVRAVMNGEIYNHLLLRGALRVEGHALPGLTDTQVVPALYQRDGLEFPKRLDGMFAIAVWDADAKRLVLTRDRAGEKPLFIARVPGGWAFASEPAALAHLPWVSGEPAADALSRYLMHGFFSGADSAWRSIRQLPPAHTLALEAGEERAARYWRPWDALREAHGSHAADDAPREVLAQLEQAVASRVPDEVPFGVFLSGGVDSGMVASLAARAVGHRFPTFSLRLVHEGYDESGWAAEVARSIGSEHHVVTMNTAAGEEALESFAAIMDQPLGDPSVLPTWALARFASHHVPVVLTGEGGDELFAGYPTYLGHRYAHLALRMPRALRDGLVAIARTVRPSHHHVTLPLMIDRFLTSSVLPPFERHWAWFGTASPAEARDLLAPSLRAALSPGAALANVARLETQLEHAGVIGTSAEVPLLAYQLMDFELYLSGALLTKVDRAAMAHGVESRAPFLRPSLIEFAVALPDRAKIRGRSTKWALKRAAAGILPAGLLARRKQGFSPPFSAWARGPMRAIVEARLSPDRIERAGVLDPYATRRLMLDHIQGRAERGRTLWTVLSLQMWAEQRLAAVQVEAPAITLAAPEVAVAG